MDNKVRIIAGDLKNRPIKIPRDTETRPALVLVRRMVCDTLAPDIPDARVLDLFAGTGAFVFEMISRGAKSAVAVDIERNMTRAIEDNARTFGIEEQVTAVSNDYLRAISNLGRGGRKFDIIIVAPPFYGDYVNKAVMAVQEEGLLDDRGILVAHYYKKDDVNREPEGLELLKTKSHGKSIIDFFGKKRQGIE
ncbi:MAG TPA: 16S rRNA (guanine(966)-N(2))-methyltransferase RsmD [candidate division Zixibacteria bacterium]|nr:16S rRNA (guanine(966)-N(2))-methyltransferase RsmD [candidate division Zixibacteria bacterium]